MQYSPGDLAILNAEIYDPGQVFSSGSETHVSKKSQPPTAKTAEGQKKRRKPQSAGEVQEGPEKKRSRGRPRLDVQDDESAADVSEPLFRNLSTQVRLRLAVCHKRA